MRSRPGSRRGGLGEGLARGGGGRWRSPRRLPASRVEQQRRVVDRARERADAGEAVEGLGVGPGGDAAALGLEADEVRPGGGDADRAGAVGAHRAGHEAGGDRGGRAARGAARACGRAYHGLRVAPKAGPSVNGHWPNSGELVLPTMTAPAARRRRATSPSPSCAAKSPAQPKAVVSPARSMSSLIATGTPSSGARSPGRAAAVGLGGLGAGGVGAHAAEGVEGRLGGVDARQRGVDELGAGGHTGGQEVGVGAQAGGSCDGHRRHGEALGRSKRPG